MSTPQVPVQVSNTTSLVTNVTIYCPVL